MSGILSVKEAAEKHGLLYIGNCNCSGYLTEKYSDGVYTLRWRKNKYMFKLNKGKNENNTIKDWTPVKELQSYLDNFFQSGGLAVTKNGNLIDK